MAARIIAVAGLCGVGKSTAVHYLAGETGGEVIYFGETVLRVVRERGLATTSANEQIVRISLREQHGDACLAVAEAGRMRAILAESRPIFIDAVYCAAELEFLSTLVSGVPFTLLGIDTPFPLRVERLEDRSVRPLSETELRARDATEMQRLDTGGVMAKANCQIANDGSMELFQSALTRALSLS